MLFDTTTTVPSDLQGFVNTFGDSSAWLLILAGCMAFIWFISEGYRRGGFLRPKKEESLHNEVNFILYIIILLGIALGLILVLTGIITVWLNLPPSNLYATKIGNHYDLLTALLLIFVGFAMFIKPLKDIPWAALVGIVVGCILGVIVILAIPENWLQALNIVSNWDIRWVYLVVFIVVATLAGLFIRFWFSAIEMISRFISWPPIALIMGIFCIIQALMLLIAGQSLW